MPKDYTEEQRTIIIQGIFQAEGYTTDKAISEVTQRRCSYTRDYTRHTPGYIGHTPRSTGHTRILQDRESYRTENVVQDIPRGLQDRECYRTEKDIPRGLQDRECYRTEDIPRGPSRLETSTDIYKTEGRLYRTCTTGLRQAWRGWDDPQAIHWTSEV